MVIAKRVRYIKNLAHNNHPSLGNTTIYGIHTVGVFLPWHRYAIWIFESVLRSECNYTGSQPYWDWTLDNPSTNGSLIASPVLKAFGGDGSASTGCIQEGPFSGPKFLNVGPVDSLALNPRCLTRAIDYGLFNGSGKWEDIYPPTMGARSYYQLQNFIDGLSFVNEENRTHTGAFATPHSLGHMGIGGDVCISFTLHPPFTIPASEST